MQILFRGVFGDWFGCGFVSLAEAQENAREWNPSAKVVAYLSPLWGT